MRPPGRIGSCPRSAPAAPPALPTAPLRELQETLTNRSFLVLMVAGIFSGMAAELTAALNIYFNTYFWELTSAQMSLLVVLNFVSAAAALVLAPRLSLAHGKKPAAIGESTAAVVLGPLPVVLRLLGWFPVNGSPALLPTLAVANTVMVTLFITSSILVASMVADVVEDSEVATGRRSEGLFFAANEFLQKSVSGIGIFTSTLLLTAIGFPRGATPGDIEPAVVHRLGLVYTPLLVVLYGLALAFLGAYRISRDTHEENLRRLANARR